MALKRFERRLERAVEGVFARAFRSGLRPVELGRRLRRELDDNRNVDVRGRTIVPNEITFTLSPSDMEQYADMVEALTRELGTEARAYARDEGYHFVGSVEVGLVESAQQGTGTFTVVSRFKEGPGGGEPGAILLPTGDRVPLGEDTLSIGRLPECNIVLGDKKVSRQHAEIRATSAGWMVVDLGSTNGTRVNGVKITERVLEDGDELTFGNTHMRFEAS